MSVAVGILVGVGTSFSCSIGSTSVGVGTSFSCSVGSTSVGVVTSLLASLLALLSTLLAFLSLLSLLSLLTLLTLLAFLSLLCSGYKLASFLFGVFLDIPGGKLIGVFFGIFLVVSRFKFLSDFISLAILVAVIGSLGSSLAVGSLVMAGDESLDGFLVLIVSLGLASLDRLGLGALGLGTPMMGLSLLVDEWVEKSGGTYISRLKGIEDGECSDWKSSSSHQGLASYQLDTNKIAKIHLPQLVQRERVGHGCPGQVPERQEWRR